MGKVQIWNQVAKNQPRQRMHWLHFNYHYFYFRITFNALSVMIDLLNAFIFFNIKLPFSACDGADTVVNNKIFSTVVLASKTYIVLEWLSNYRQRQPYQYLDYSQLYSNLTSDLEL